MNSAHLRIGPLLFDGIDQFDLTGPFEVLSRLTDSEYSIYAKTASPVRDINGLKLTPDAALADAPRLDVLHVPGGPGQEALMDDSEVLGWLSNQVAGGSRVFSVCTGALLLGAAGLLTGRRATTHWASLDLLPYFGASPVDERVVADGNMIFTAGSPPASTAPCCWPRNCEARRQRKLSSWPSPTHPNRPSTAGGQTPHRLPSWQPPSGPWRHLPLAGRRQPGASLSALASQSSTMRRGWGYVFLLRPGPHPLPAEFTGVFLEGAGGAVGADGGHMHDDLGALLDGPPAADAGGEVS